MALDKNTERVDARFKLITNKAKIRYESSTGRKDWKSLSNVKKNRWRCQWLIDTEPHSLCIWQLQDSCSRSLLIEMYNIIIGIYTYELSPDYVEQSSWRFCGGDGKVNDKIYYSQVMSQWSRPHHIDKCLCGVDIVRNMYVTNGFYLLILGSCCYKRFVPKNKRSKICGLCGEIHHNKKDNLCNHCRLTEENRREIEKILDAEDIIETYERNAGYQKCAKCQKPCRVQFLLCYNCYQEARGGRKIKAWQN